MTLSRERSAPMLTRPRIAMHSVALRMEVLVRVLLRIDPLQRMDPIILFKQPQASSSKEVHPATVLLIQVHLPIAEMLKLESVIKDDQRLRIPTVIPQRLRRSRPIAANQKIRRARMTPNPSQPREVEAGRRFELAA